MAICGIWYSQTGSNAQTVSREIGPDQLLALGLIESEIFLRHRDTTRQRTRRGINIAGRFPAEGGQLLSDLGDSRMVAQACQD